MTVDRDAVAAVAPFASRMALVPTTDGRPGRADEFDGVERLDPALENR